MKFIFKLAVVMIFSVPFLVFAQKADNDTVPSSKSDNKTGVISNVMGEGAVKGNVILVDKFAKKMFNVKITGDKVEIVDEFPIVYGANLGDKMIRGDNKTPEGIYYITTYRSSDYLLRQYGNYAKIYGAGSFPLNYPNPVDRLNNKTGSGIWIHGTNPDTNKENTQGCVALRNEDFESLKEKIGVKYPVVIADNLTYLSTDQYNNLREKLKNKFDGFIKAWGGSDYADFKNFVHENYHSNASANASSYLENKKTLMKSYPKRAVVANGTKILMKDENYVVFETEQFYCAPNMTSMGDKKYYFTASKDGNLKLISEEFTQSDAKPFINNEIIKFVDGWASAWQDQKLDKYMDYYSKSFKNDKIGKYNAWLKYKEELFDINKKISVKISDISWKRTTKGYSVSFTQGYSSDVVSDNGIKTLILDGCPTQFGIVSETWKAR